MNYRFASSMLLLLLLLGVFIQGGQGRIHETDSISYQHPRNTMNFLQRTSIIPSTLGSSISIGRPPAGCTNRKVFLMTGHNERNIYYCTDWSGLRIRLHFFTCKPGTVFDKLTGECIAAAVGNDSQAVNEGNDLGELAGAVDANWEMKSNSIIESDYTTNNDSTTDNTISLPTDSSANMIFNMNNTTKPEGTGSGADSSFASDLYTGISDTASNLNFSEGIRHSYAINKVMNRSIAPVSVIKFGSNKIGHVNLEKASVEITRKTENHGNEDENADLNSMDINLERRKRFAVTEDNIPRLAVTEDNIPRLSVTEDNIPRLVVTADNRTRLAVTEDNITRLAVTEDNMTRLAVTEDNRTRLAATEGNIPRLAVTEDNITRLAVTEDNRTLVAVEAIIESYNDTCSYICFIDTYVHGLMSVIPVRIPSYVEEKYSIIIKRFNARLMEAQRGSYIWRRGDDIFSDIRRVYHLGRTFGPSFQRKYLINQRRIARLLDDERGITEVKKLEEDIAYLMKQIVLKLGFLNMTTSPDVQQFIQNDIQSTQRKLQDKKNQLQMKSAITRDFEELISFLEFVRNDANIICDQANVTKTKLETLRDNVIRDSGSFQASFEEAEEGMKALREEKEEHNREILDTRNKALELEKKIKETRKRGKILEAAVEKKINELKDYFMEHGLAIQSALDMESLGEKLSAIPVIGWIAGPILIRDADEQRKTYARQRMMVIQEHSLEVQTLFAQLNRSMEETSQYYKDIADHDSKADTLIREISHFSYLDQSLKSILRDTNSILRTVGDAITSIQALNRAFRDIVHHLEELLDEAKLAKTAAEVKNVKHFIYNEISKMQQSWNQADFRIRSLGTCSISACIL